MIRQTTNPHLDRQAGEWTDLLRQLRRAGDVIGPDRIATSSAVLFMLISGFTLIGGVFAVGGGQ